MDLDARGWMLYYDRLKSDYQNKRRASSFLNNMEAKDMMDRVNDLEKDLNTMKDSPMQYDLWSSEIVRRQVILDTLRKQIVSISGESKSMSSSPYSNAPQVSSTNTSTPVVNPLTTSDRALVQRQKEVMMVQDTMILDIEKGVDKLHQTAKDIGKEAKIQNKILDELDVHVDQATEGLKEETKHAEAINRKTDVCYMYICVCVEVIVLVILVIVLFIH